MSKGRLEAFSDGVFAIIITIMVLELRPPATPTLEGPDGLLVQLPIFLSYALSFTNVGIYWNNHHHLLQASTVVNGRVLWSNLFLLFWLSLFPFVTAWMGKDGFAPLTVAAYGVVALITGGAYSLLVRELRGVPGQAQAIEVVSGGDYKGILSLLLYAVGIPVALAFPFVALVLYVVVAVMWFVPDKRVEHALRR
ncbi:MAG: TMEM175 family protein [Polyangiales bacterium]